jgi:hypothetical protein
MPAFQAMASTGVTFGGSLEKMQEMVGRSGLKLEEFQGIVGQFGTTISGVGEEKFVKLVRGVQDSTREFGLYNQTLSQQGESVAFFLDMLAKGGSAYGMSTEMQREGAVKYVRELTALTELTGKDRKEIQARQKAAAEDAAIMLRIRTLRKTNPEEAARLEANKSVIAGQFGEMGPAMARIAVGMQMGLMPSDPQARAMMSMGELMPSMTALSRGLTTGTTEDTMRLVQQVQTALTEGPGAERLQIQAQQGGPYAGGAEMFAKMLPEAERAQAAAARPGGMERILNIFSGRGGNLDRATTAMQKVTMDTARITGDFKAALYAATQQLGLFTKVLEPLAAATGAGAGAANSFYGMAASGMSGAASALATGAAVALMPKLLASTALKAAIPRLLGGGGLGLTSMLGSTGMMSGLMQGASTMGGLGRGRLIGAGGLGVAGGLGGAYLGSKVGLDGWLGGALGGAATGALAGIGAGPGGILAGALLGGLVGGITGYGTSSASAAEAKPGEQTGDASSVLQDSTALVEMQASSTSYVSAMAALVSRVAAQATMTSLAPPMAPQNDALLGMVTTLNSTVAAQTPYIQDQARQARITAGIIGDFA